MAVRRFVVVGSESAADQYLRSKRRREAGADPAQAEPGTVRKLYAESKERNAIHASDSPENAAREIAFFFPESELKGLWG